VARLTDDMKWVVREQRLAYVATVNGDGTPNLSPKATTTVWDDEHLVFADLRSPGTVANLRRNPAVEVNVVDPFLRKGYRFTGTAEVLTKGEVFDLAVRFFGEGVDAVERPEERIRSVVLIHVDRALPLVSPAYELGPTEEEVVRSWEAYYGSLRRPADGWSATFVRGGTTYRVSTDRTEINRELVHRFLHDDSYWAAGVPRVVLDRAIDNSLPFGAYDDDGEQVAFGRVVTDRATFAWLADVFVVERLRGKGIGQALVGAIVSHPDLQRLRWFLLATRDAHELYRRFGFEELTEGRASWLMAVWRSAGELYRR